MCPVLLDKWHFSSVEFNVHTIFVFFQNKSKVNTCSLWAPGHFVEVFDSNKNMKIRVSLFLNTELPLVTCAWLKNYGNTTQKQRGILRMWKPAILNSYLGEEGTTVSATVHHTGAERQKDRGHRQREREKERWQSADFFFYSEEKGDFLRALVHQQHATVLPSQSYLKIESLTSDVQRYLKVLWL